MVNASSTNPFEWTFNWVPTESGVYCITAYGQDTAGNVETSTVITNISFTKATTTEEGGGGSGSGSNGGSTGGSSGSTGGGSSAPANGPIVGSFGGGFGIGGDLGGNTGSTGTNTGTTGGNTNAAGGTVLTGTEGGFGNGPLASASGMMDLDTYYGNTTSTPTTTISDADIADNDQVAAVGFLGGWNNWYWLWILLLIIIILGVYYSTRRRENK